MIGRLAYLLCRSAVVKERERGGQSRQCCGCDEPGVRVIKSLCGICVCVCVWSIYMSGEVCVKRWHQLFVLLCTRAERRLDSALGALGEKVWCGWVHTKHKHFFSLIRTTRRHGNSTSHPFSLHFLERPLHTIHTHKHTQAPNAYKARAETQLDTRPRPLHHHQSQKERQNRHRGFYRK